ncbi:hypothetical protein BCR32DRAFT_249743 [Anaeromyces robustus]|uniref:RRM domain-containing protein n=1 Tax=Anaeromyces robustus TaxID=1754192 RepID=A0A1Y1WNU8_9FUNG|nr:hypothetical protein BCR32DRAFT_249743 [Anaeromyces robustus]|eukprot:ORX75193.1 hypothetical protein BCR32DRAFT_249743 [Anaeromyces robustus]
MTGTSVNEEILLQVLNDIGPVKNIKIGPDTNSILRNHAYVKYYFKEDGERAIEQLDRSSIDFSFITARWAIYDPFKKKRNPIEHKKKIKKIKKINKTDIPTGYIISEMQEYVNSLFDIRKHDIIEIINKKNLNELKIYKDNNNIKEFSEINNKYFNIQEYCCVEDNQVPNIDDDYFNIIEYCRSNKNIPEWMTNFIISHYTQKRYDIIELIRMKKIKEIIEYMKYENENDDIEFISLNDENFDIVEFCKDKNNKVADYMKDFILSHLTQSRSKVVEFLRENNYIELKRYTKENKLEFKTLNDEDFNIYNIIVTVKITRRERSIFDDIIIVNDRYNDDEDDEKTFDDLVKFVKDNNIKFKNINDENFDIIEYLDLKNKSTEITNFIFKQFDEKRSKDLNDKSFDILTYAINFKASNDMINFIINQRGYDFSKYNSVENSPLYLALYQENLSLVDLLIRNRTYEISKLNINQYNSKITKKLINKNKLNKKIIKYLMNHGYKLEYLINSFGMNDINSDLYQYILKNYIFDNTFILYLINVRKNQIRLSTIELFDKIKNEKRKYNTSLSPMNTSLSPMYISLSPMRLSEYYSNRAFNIINSIEGTGRNFLIISLELFQNIIINILQ